MNIPYWLRLAIERHPSLYMRLLRIKNNGRAFEKVMLSDATELIVEGFPRCANSFAAQSIRLLCRAHGRELRFATHAHSPAHVIAGLRMGKPALVLIREPTGAITSLQALALQSGSRVEGTNGLIRRYIQFYEMLMTYRDSMVISEFTRTTSQYPSVIHELNQRFDLGLPEVDTQEELEELVIPVSQEHLAPSGGRELIKKRVREDFEKSAKLDLLKRAEQTYMEFIAYDGRH